MALEALLFRVAYSVSVFIASPRIEYKTGVFQPSSPELVRASLSILSRVVLMSRKRSAAMSFAAVSSPRSSLAASPFHSACRAIISRVTSTGRPLPRPDIMNLIKKNAKIK